MGSDLPGVIDHHGALFQCCRDMKTRMKCVKIYLRRTAFELKYNLQILTSKINDFDATK